MMQEYGTHVQKDIKLCHMSDILGLQTDDCAVSPRKRKTKARKGRVERFKLGRIGRDDGRVVVRNNASSKDSKLADIMEWASRRSIVDGWPHQVIQIVRKRFDNNV
jgi:hypothetical protein